MASISEQLASYYLNFDKKKLPQEVLEKAKNVVLDYLGCLIGGAGLESSKIVTETFLSMGGAEEATLNGGVKTTCDNAAFIPTPYIQFIIDNGILSKAKQYRELGILKKSSSMPYNLLIKTMTANLLNLDSIVMFCGDDLPTAADIDYMQYFIKMLDRYVDINYNNHSHEKQVNTSQSFFSDCIEGKIISPEEMHRGSLLVGIPYTGRFSLACVRFESFSYSAANFLIKVLETANPFGSVFIYKDEVILICIKQVRIVHKSVQERSLATVLRWRRSYSNIC